MSFKLVTGAEITTYCKLLEAERDGESGRQNFGFHMKIIDGYSGGSSSVYVGLGKPGSSDGVGSFCWKLCHTKAMVMKATERESQWALSL